VEVDLMRRLFYGVALSVVFGATALGLAGCSVEGTEPGMAANGAEPAPGLDESGMPESESPESASEPLPSLSEPPAVPAEGMNIPTGGEPQSLPAEDPEGAEEREPRDRPAAALYAAGPLAGSDAPVTSAPPGTITLTDCFVELIEEAQVPAQEPGVLVKIMVREGDEVQKGVQLAQIDDAHPRMQHEAARQRYEAAREEAENDVNVRYSKAAALVARNEWQQAVEANKKTVGSVPVAEVERLRLKYDEMVLSIEQAEMRRRVAALEKNVAAAEVNAAIENLKRRRITSPLDAMVVELYRHDGEWVQPGDPVMHVVRINRLRVEGVVNSAEAAGHEISGRPVRVTVELARGRTVTLDGRITFVDPVVRAGGKYEVWAEVDNVQESGRWLLQPGLPATMTIQLNR
jgi:multidrug efflux pump subunit AcrA (membrane-fusion protein)